MERARSAPRTAAAALTAALLASAGPARADRAVIRHPGMHPSYRFEAEPHLVVGPFPHDFAPGAGFRGTVILVDNGFVKTINNSVGIGFGFDWTDPAIVLPVVMQWNFWLSRRWSVFGEPGFAIRAKGKAHFDPFVFYAGGRWHFADWASLTMRVGYPTASVGVSFLL